jgi:hypothetical protein
MTKAVIGKLFDEEKHLEEKLRRAKEYSALEYVALECVHIIETLDRASNKIGLEQMGLMNISNPNTVLGKYIAVKYSDISNAGGFGYYVTPKNNNVGQSNLIASQNMMMPNAMFMTQERSAEIVRVQDFVKKWSDLFTYVNTRPDDQNFITEFKFSYAIMKNLVKKYLGQDLRSMIMANPNRVYNETSVLIDILNNQLLPKLLNDPNYKIPYKNLQPEIKNLGYNARYVFVMTCDGVYTNGNGMNPNQSNIKAWAQTGTN